MPEGWRRSTILVMLAVVAGFALMGLISRRLPKVPESREPVIPVYPAAYKVKNLAAPERRWRRVIFEVEEDYPSENVLDYYAKTLAQLGYTLSDPQETPVWQPETVEDKFRRLVLRQYWVDPRRLRVLELQLIAVEIIKRDPENDRVISREMRPGLEVMLTLSRKVIIPGKAETPPQG
jgi:hypothetical protein